MRSEKEIIRHMNRFKHIAENGDSSRIRNNADIYISALKWVLEEK